MCILIINIGCTVTEEDALENQPYSIDFFHLLSANLKVSKKKKNRSQIKIKCSLAHSLAQLCIT